MAKLYKWKWNIEHQGQKPLKNAVFFGVAKKFEDDTHTCFQSVTYCMVTSLELTAYFAL